MDVFLFGTTALAHVYHLRMGNVSAKVSAPSNRLLELSIQGDLPAITALVEASASNERLPLLNQQDANGNAALHGAVFGGHLNVVEYLVAQGASVQLCNKLGCGPLWIAAGYNHPRILECLYAAAPNFLTKANHHGDTPLIAAASKGYVEVCRLLLELASRHGVLPTASLCANNQSNDTALSVALGASMESVDLLAMLCDASIVNTVNALGLTPLLIACERDVPLAVTFLLERGADPGVKDTAGHNILAVASFCGSTKVVGFLLHESIEIGSALLNAPSAESGCTPLWLATRAGHVECVELLLAAGADREIANVQGLTPLHAAQKSNRADLVQLLTATAYHETGDA